jgi:hypothetical protein
MEEMIENHYRVRTFGELRKILEMFYENDDATSYYASSNIEIIDGVAIVTEFEVVIKFRPEKIVPMGYIQGEKGVI